MIELVLYGFALGAGSIPVMLCYHYKDRVGKSVAAMLLGFLFIFLYGGAFFVLPWLSTLRIDNLVVVVASLTISVSIIYLTLWKQLLNKF